MKCLVIAAFLSVAVAAAAPKDILILHSYRVGYAWTDEASRGFIETFGQAGEFNLWSEFLDARRQSYPRNSALQLSQIASRHQGRKFDLILAVDDEALDFIVNRSNGLFGSVPVVFCGINEWELTYKLPRNRYTGLLQKLPVDQVLSAISFIQPKTTDVFVVSENSAFGASMRRAFEQALPPSGKFRFHSIDGRYLSLEKIKAEVKAIAPGGIVVLCEIRQDSESRYVDRKSGEMAVASVSSVPVLAVDISRVGDGILMGIPNGGFEHAKAASNIALKLLGGAAPDSIPAFSPGDVVLNFDHAEMQRWNLSESALPPGSQILNRPPSIWREYRNWILAGLAVAGLQFLAISALVVNVVRRRRIQARLRDALRSANEAAALKSRFIANMSHELRTPMNGVLGLLDELQSTKLDPEQQSDAAIAADSARSLLAVLNDILDISQMEAGRLKIVSGPFPDPFRFGRIYQRSAAF